MGFNPDLTARDNVIINAIMLGLTRKQARERFDEIIAFAELEEFIDLKLKNYSSGMSVRLGFSTAIQVDADVLLVDEVLAVGDAAFQAKCFAEFERMKREGRTILFVTHDMGAVERFCDRGDADRARRGGATSGRRDEMSRMYSELNFGHTGAAPTPAGAGGRAARSILGVWCEDETGERIVSARAGRRVPGLLRGRVRARRSRIRCSRSPSATTSATRSSWPPARSTGRTGSFDAGERVTVRFEFPNWLAPSRYTLTPSVSEGAATPSRSCARTTSPR